MWHLYYTLAVMPAKNPRVNVVLERPLYEALSRVAKRDGASLSLKATDLLRDALETHEDLALGRIAEERARTFDRSRALSHREVWQSAGKPRDDSQPPPSDTACPQGLAEGIPEAPGRRLPGRVQGRRLRGAQER